MSATDEFFLRNGLELFKDKANLAKAISEDAPQELIDYLKKNLEVTMRARSIIEKVGA